MLKEKEQRGKVLSILAKNEIKKIFNKEDLL